MEGTCSGRVRSTPPWRQWHIGLMFELRPRWCRSDLQSAHDWPQAFVPVDPTSRTCSSPGLDTAWRAMDLSRPFGVIAARLWRLNRSASIICALAPGSPSAGLNQYCTSRSPSEPDAGPARRRDKQRKSVASARAMRHLPEKVGYPTMRALSVASSTRRNPHALPASSTFGGIAQATATASLRRLRLNSVVARSVDLA